MRAHTARNLTKLELRRANGDYKNPSHYFSRNSYVSIIATTRFLFYFFQLGSSREHLATRMNHYYFIFLYL